MVGDDDSQEAEAARQRRHAPVADDCVQLGARLFALRGSTLSVLPVPPQGKPVHQHKEPPASPPVSPTLEPDSSAESPSPRALSDSPPEIAAATPPPPATSPGPAACTAPDTGPLPAF